MDLQKWNDSPLSTLKPVIATIFRGHFQEGNLETPRFGHSQREACPQCGQSKQ